MGGFGQAARLCQVRERRRAVLALPTPPPPASGSACAAAAFSFGMGASDSAARGLRHRAVGERKKRMGPDRGVSDDVGLCGNACSVIGASK